MSTEKRTIVIPYRDGRIRKELHLKPNNQHDMLFYDSYKRLPPDNRNYMASLYAREQRYGVNDDIGHRVQELALKNPVENDVILREKRTVERESLNESLAAADARLKVLQRAKTQGQLDASQQEEEKRLINEVAALKRRIRGLDMNYNRLLNLQMAKTGQPLASMTTDKTDLKTMLQDWEDIIGKRMADVLETFVDKLPSNAGPEKSNMDYVKANTAFLQLLCERFGIAHNDITQSIESIYSFMSAIMDYSLSQNAFDTRYSGAMEHIVNLNETINDIAVNKINAHSDIPDTKIHVGIEALEHLWVSVLVGIGNAFTKTIDAAEQKDKQKYDRMKDIFIDEQAYTDFIDLMFSSTDYTRSDKYKDAKTLEEKIQNKLARIVNAIYLEMMDLQRVIYKTSGGKTIYTPLSTRLKAFDRKLRQGFKNPKTQDTTLYGEYNESDNTLTFNRLELDNTGYAIDFNATFNDAFVKKRTNTDGRVVTGTSPPKNPTTADINKDVIKNVSSFQREIYRGIESQVPGLLNPELTGKLLGQGVTYKAPSEEDERFNRIVEMGNPLKKVRSQRYYRMD